MPEEKIHGAWVSPKPTDWVLGAETAIKYEVRVDSWTAFLPTDERQRNDAFDSNMCVTYSGLNCLETQLVYLLSKNLLPQKTVDFLTTEGYLDANGRPNFNEAFSAKLNGTTIEGNNLGAFWESARKVGVIPQKDWLDIKTATVWADLMKEIPQNLLDKGKRFLEHFDINYEWTLLGIVDPNILTTQVKHAPLHIAAPVCEPWNSDDIKNVCGSTRLQHATMIYGTEKDIQLFDLDHYNPFRKRLEWFYYIPYAIKGIIKEKTVTTPIKPTHVFTKTIVFQEKSEEVKQLQKALRYLGFFKYPIDTGNYGDITRIAVRDFQFKYQVASFYELEQTNGKIFGAKSRTKMNELLK
jgi:hypothetical protein